MTTPAEWAAQQNKKPVKGKDEVQEASEESFPASDPPSWTPVNSATTPAVTEKPVEQRTADKHSEDEYKAGSKPR